MQTATNPETGERVILIGDSWKKIEQSATNDKGVKAYLVGGQWLTDAPQKPEASFGGVAAEAGKGLLRGASDVGMTIAKGAASVLDPTGFLGAQSGIETVANLRVAGLPGSLRGEIQAKPEGELERFAGTAGELVGGGIAGGAAGTVRGALGTVAMGLGGAAGEQVGGETGKLVGALGSVIGFSTLAKLLPYLGKTASDVASTVGAAFGREKSAGKIASDVVTRLSGEDALQIRIALKKATEYVPGAKPTAGEALTEAQMGKPDQFGGALIRLQKDLYGARGVEDVLPSVARQQEQAVSNARTALDKLTAPMRSTALESANRSGIRKTDILSGIEEELRRPGIRASEVANKALSDIKDKINRLDETVGRVDAHDIYTVRKEIGNTIEKFSKETANWDKRLSAGLERTIQKHIDDAIEKAGGSGWKEYLKTYSEGMKKIEAQGERLEAMKNIQSGVKSQTPSAGAEELPKLPTLLSRPMMALNFALKMVAEDANAPVVKEVARKMRNSEEFARLIKLPVGSKERTIAEDIARQVSAAAATIEGEK